MKALTNEIMRVRLKRYIDTNFSSIKAYAKHHGLQVEGVYKVLRGEKGRPVTQTYAATIRDGNIYVREDKTLIKFKVYKDEKASGRRKL